MRSPLRNMPETVKAPKKGSKKAVSKATKTGKKRRKSRKESYAIYVYKAMGIMNSFVSDILSASPGSPPVWLNTTSAPPSPPGRSRPLSACCCPVSWLNTPCLRHQGCDQVHQLQVNPLITTLVMSNHYLHKLRLNGNN
uniref:Histone H2B n=1 Tax=Labrus bergylta TaxID=56723 RepID=A0A3Q3FQR0_9LABR